LRPKRRSRSKKNPIAARLAARKENTQGVLYYYSDPGQRVLYAFFARFFLNAFFTSHKTVELGENRWCGAVRRSHLVVMRVWKPWHCAMGHRRDGAAHKRGKLMLDFL